MLGPRPETLEIFSLVLPPLPRAGRARHGGPWRASRLRTTLRGSEARSEDESRIVVRDLHGVDPVVLRQSKSARYEKQSSPGSSGFLLRLRLLLGLRLSFSRSRGSWSNFLTFTVIWRLPLFIAAAASVPQKAADRLFPMRFLQTATSTLRGARGKTRRWKPSRA